MINVRVVVAGFAVALSSGAVGCSNDTAALRGQEGGDAVGSISVGLQLATGLTFNTVSYSLTGPAAFSRTATVDVSHSTTIAFSVSAIPAGDGYALTVSGTLSDGVTTCVGSAGPFGVSARASTTVSVHLLCREPARNGSVRVAGTVNICPVIDSLAINPTEIEVGNAVALTSAAHDTDNVPAALTYAWSATGGTIAAPGAQNTTFTCTAPGSFEVSLAISDGDCSDLLSQTVTCSPGMSSVPTIKINEIESNGGTPGDWVELLNVGASPVNVSGWIFKDNDDTHVYAIPGGSIVAPGGYLVLEEAAFGFGLGAAESARLFDGSGINLVDTHSWTAHASTTYGRCPNGTGAFTTMPTVTKGAANDCSGGAGGAGGAGGTGGVGGVGGVGGAGGVGGIGGGGGIGGAGGVGGVGGAGGGVGGAGGGVSVVRAAWPGSNTVVTVDQVNQFPSNLSGLTYQPAAGGSPAVLWAVQNSPSVLFRLQADAAGNWTSTLADDWAAGKTVVYPTGTGNPDIEGVTKAEWDAPFIYVAAERSNSNSGVSRLSLLRFDTSAAGATLIATHEWDVTADLPAVGANLGFEAVTWIPDSYLVANGFVDQSTGLPYVPAQYPNHGNGIFFVGVEANGMIHAYMLDHTPASVATSFRRLASFSSGQAGTMGIEFDRETGYLWSYCDNTCGNTAAVLDLRSSPGTAPTGLFQPRRIFERASTLPDSNNEGIAIAPESECLAGVKPFYWSDDSNFGAHALRRDTIPCGAFLP